MIPLTFQAKLVTIMILAILNILLLKRKRPDKESFETLTIQGNNNYNVNNNDKKDKNDNIQINYSSSSKNVDLNKNNNLLESNIKQMFQKQEDLFFVRGNKTENNNNNGMKQKVQDDVNKINDNKKEEKQMTRSLPIFQSLQKPNQNQCIQPVPRNQQKKQQIHIPQLVIRMQEQPVEEQFQDINDSKSSKKSKSQSFKQQIKQKARNYQYSQRKFVQPQYQSQGDSQSDSHTQKIKSNHQNNKQKSSCNAHCECCKKPSNPRQTLKRCIQDIIFSTFQQMIGNNSIQHNYGTKKKKRSL